MARGRGGKFGRNKRGGNKGRGGGAWSSTTRKDYDEVVKENEAFERYYNDMNIVPEGEERDQFWAALKRELPNSFRFCGSKGHALAVQKNLTDNFIPQITSMKFNDEAVEPPKPIEWYPEKLAYQMTTPKNVVRKFAPFSAFQKFLVSETAVGNISRQEAVSMIPPLLLDVQSHHTVLDLCAAPGSKSAQLIEMLHQGEEARLRTVMSGETPTDGDYTDEGRSTGLLVANDVNYQRAQMLVHQVKRLNSPNLIVMNHDATLFPSIELPTDPPVNGQRQKSKYLKFDRILADVPCSGDGTCRKNPNIWKDWIPGNGLGLHLTQVRILVRALQMLKVGGRVVYSTCSLNPVENEAVIASAVDRCGGLDKVDIIDVSTQLPELKRFAGLKQWIVMDKDGRTWTNYAEVEDAKSKKYEPGLDRVIPGMFAPVNGSLPLDRCVRVYPHQQDTGGFFITVLEKKSEIKAKAEGELKASRTTPSVVSIAKEIESKPAEDGIAIKLDSVQAFNPTNTDVHMDQGNASAAQRQNKEALTDTEPVSNKRPLDEAGDSATANAKRAKVEPVDTVGTGAIGEPGQMEHQPLPPSIPPRDDQEFQTASSDVANAPTKNRRNNQPHEEPFKYIDTAHEDLESIFSFYEISPRFPRDRFMVRNASGNPVKAMYYTTALAKAILTKNEGKGMKFVHSGVKMFVKQDSQGQDVCRWRVQSEGLPILDNWVGEGRIVRMTKRETLRKLLIEMFPRVNNGGWEELGEIGERVRDIGMGCCVLRVEPSSGDDGFGQRLNNERLTLPLWRSISALNLMLPKEERKAMLLRLFDDDTPLIDHSQIKRDQQKPANGEAVGETAAVDGAVEGAVEGADDDDASAAPKSEEDGVGGVSGDAMDVSAVDDEPEAEGGVKL